MQCRGYIMIFIFSFVGNYIILNAEWLFFFSIFVTKKGKQKNIWLMVDAEYTYMNPALNLITLAMMLNYNHDKPLVAYTYQNYLKVCCLPVALWMLRFCNIEHQSYQIFTLFINLFWLYSTLSLHSVPTRQ